MLNIRIQRGEVKEVRASILSADFSQLGMEVRRLAQAGVDGFHLDVMDGQFVPNLSMGPSIVSAVRRTTELPLDVHLMMYDPFRYIETFAEAGADSIVFHVEATEDIEDTLKYIRKCNRKAGLAVSPETSPELLRPFLSLCDYVVVMAVSPGFGGQSFLPDTLDNVEVLRKLIEGKNIPIIVDGGITPSTARECALRGASGFVVGNFLFEKGCVSSNVGERVERIRGGNSP